MSRLGSLHVTRLKLGMKPEELSQFLKENLTDVKCEPCMLQFFFCEKRNALKPTESRNKHYPNSRAVSEKLKKSVIAGAELLVNNLCHLNIQSLISNSNDLELIAKQANFNFICLQ